MSPGPLRELIAQARRLGPLGWAAAVSLGTSLAVAVAYARIAGPAAQGTYHMALAVITIAGLACIPGTSTATARAAAQGRVPSWPLFRRRLPRCALVGAGLAAVGGVLTAAGAGPLAPALLAGAITLPAYVGADMGGAELLGARRYRAYLHYQLALQGLPAAAVIAAVMAAPDDPWLAVLGFTLATGAVQLGRVAATRARASANDEDERYAREFSGVMVLTVVDVRLDVLLAGALLGAREAGIVAVARQVALIIKHLWSSILSQPVFASLAAAGRESAMAAAGRYRRRVIVALTVPAALGAALAPLVIPAAFGERFADAVPVAQLFFAAHAVSALGGVETVLLRAQALVREMRILYVVLPLTSAVLLLVLVPVAGVTGPGWKALAVAALSSWLAIVLARRGLSRPEAPASG